MPENFTFHMLRRQNENPFITRPMPFHGDNLLDHDDLSSALEFAFGMAFSAQGEHRRHRSGGTIMRKSGEVFSNTLQGKLAEFYFYRRFSHQLELNVPDLSLHPLGIWDSGDFSVHGRRIAIKSTKHFGNLMLLEKKDWDGDGNYLPDQEYSDEFYSAFVLIRLQPDLDGILKSKRLLYTTTVDPNEIRDVVTDIDWRFDVAGWAGINDLRLVIRTGEYLRRGELLNGRTQMDADNFYIQAGDLRTPSSLVQRLT